MTTRHTGDVRDARRRKAVLFCPGCDHESPPTGDWIVRERDGHRAYACPECATTVTRRATDHGECHSQCGGVETPADD